MLLILSCLVPLQALGLQKRCSGSKGVTFLLQLRRLHPQSRSCPELRTWALSSPLQSHSLPGITSFTNFQYCQGTLGMVKAPLCGGLCFETPQESCFDLELEQDFGNKGKHVLCLSWDDTCNHAPNDDNPLTVTPHSPGQSLLSRRDHASRQGMRRFQSLEYFTCKHEK